MDKISISKLSGKEVRHVLRGEPLVVTDYNQPVAFLARLPKDDEELRSLFVWLKGMIDGRGV